MDMLMSNWEYVAIFMLVVDKIVAMSPSKMDDLVWTSVKKVLMGMKVMKGKKLSQLIQKDESRLRLNMWELVGLMSIDNSNKKLADELSRSYKKNVTIFMRDMLSLVKKMK